MIKNQASTAKALVTWVLADAGKMSDTATSSEGSGSPREQSKKGSLREYVDKFSPEVVQEMARVVSQEAAHLIDMQTLALFGDYRQLQEQMRVRPCLSLTFNSSLGPRMADGGGGFSAS